MPNERVRACEAALPDIDIAFRLVEARPDLERAVIFGTPSFRREPVERCADGTPAEALVIVEADQTAALFARLRDAGLLDDLAEKDPPPEGAYLSLTASRVVFHTGALRRGDLEPLREALPSGLEDAFDRLLFQLEVAPEPDRALIEAAALGDLELLAECLAAGADPNAAPPDDLLSPLHYAVASDRVDLARALLEAGAAPTDTGVSQARGAAMMSLLMRHGAPLLEDEEESHSTLYAMSTCVLLEEALRRGADPNLATRSHETPLTFHADWCNLEAVRTLLAWGADPSYVDAESGTSVLDFAAASGNLEIVRLLDAGATVHHPSEERSQALARALTSGHLAVAELLREAGARLPDAELRERAAKLRVRLDAFSAESPTSA